MDKELKRLFDVVEASGFETVGAEKLSDFNGFREVDPAKYEEGFLQITCALNPERNKKSN